MKTLFCIALCVLLGLASAFGQSLATMKVNVPFSFSLDDRTYPAGEYTFSAMKENVVLLRNTNESTSSMIVTDHAAGHSRRVIPSIQFECYDRECFVSQLWIPGHDDGFQLRRTKAELRAAAKTSGRYLALAANSAAK